MEIFWCSQVSVRRFSGRESVTTSITVCAAQSGKIVRYWPFGTAGPLQLACRAVQTLPTEW